MVLPATQRLAKLHRAQVRRDPWPDFSAFDPTRYEAPLRRAAAVQWAGRARNEHGSIHQFSALAFVLAEAGVPLTFHGALARLITDEVRHAELCAEAAHHVYPEGLADGPDHEPAIFRWPVPGLPWPRPPGPDATRTDRLAWAADAILSACCFGETLSRPMLDAIAVVSTDPMAEAIAAQILRDEHLHAAFGWEALDWLLRELGEPGRTAVEAVLPRRYTEFERSTCCGIGIERVAGRELVIERTEAQNLGTLSDEQYAMIFFATIETEVIPALERLGLPAREAWAKRPAA
jgi:hypothetical protein